jgi:hypothetical protein
LRNGEQLGAREVGDRMGEPLRRKGRTNGYMFQNAQGKQAKIGNYVNKNSWSK